MPPPLLFRKVYGYIMGRFGQSFRATVKFQRALTMQNKFGVTSVVNKRSSTDAIGSQRTLSHLHDQIGFIRFRRFSSAARCRKTRTETEEEISNACKAFGSSQDGLMLVEAILLPSMTTGGMGIYPMKIWNRRDDSFTTWD